MFGVLERVLEPTAPPDRPEPPPGLTAFYWHFARQAKGLFAALFVFVVFAEWAVRGNPDMLVLPGPLPGMGPAATDSSVTLHLIAAAIFGAGFGAAGFLAQGRASNAARRHIQGLGLGLHIAREIVQRHGGRLWAVSAGEQQGTTFSVWLPGAADVASDAVSTIEG